MQDLSSDCLAQLPDHSYYSLSQQVASANQKLKVLLDL